jgi:endoglucanase
MDRSFIASRKLVDFFETTAATHDLPYQYKRPGLGGTDAGTIHLAREGITSITIAPAARYIHSPVALVELADIDHTIKLVAAALNDLPSGW